MPKTKPTPRAKTKAKTAITPAFVRSGKLGTAGNPLALSVTRRDLFSYARTIVKSGNPLFARTRGKGQHTIVLLSQAAYEALSTKPAAAAKTASAAG